MDNLKVGLGLEDEIVSIRICIVGDCGVGKSTLAKRLCHTEIDVELSSSAEPSEFSYASSLITENLGPNSLPSQWYHPTIGCATHIKLIKDPVDSLCEYFVELVDIGGNPRYLGSLSAYHYQIDGIIFMWDCSLEGTFHSIDTWLDCVKKNCGEAEELLIRNGLSTSEGSNHELDLLIVGNKADKVSPGDFERLKLSCPKHVFMSSRAASIDSTAFDNFFSRVYWNRGGPAKNKLQECRKNAL